MNRPINMSFVSVLILLFFWTGVCLLCKRSIAQERASALGTDKGYYTEPVYKDERRTSDFPPRIRCCRGHIC